jgi:formiminoglutamase
MHQNWLKPFTASFVKTVQALPEQVLGRQLALHHTSIPDLKKVRVALIGAGDKEADEVRKYLYQMAYPFPKGSIADIGNLRKTDPSFLIPLLYELMSGKILPILISGKDDIARAQFLAYQEAKALANMAIVDDSGRVEKGAVYADLVRPRHALLFHFGLIGYQVHQLNPDTLQYFQKQHFDHVRLGKSRASMEECEPVLRDADMLAFHLSALKQSEAPGVANPSPSGYFVEEACQLCRYAGFSDKLTSFGVYGFQKDKDQDGQTAQAAAQMIWYFLEGFFNRKGDYPVSTAGLTEYVVEFRHLNYQLTFWKSIKSGRWWMQVPVHTGKKLERHRLVPCTYQDYQSACREELPDRLMQAIGRFQ